MIFSPIFLAIIERYVSTKVISEALKRNVQLENFDIKALYSEIREILVKKVIQ
jgi:hypothetical protein